MHRHKSRITAEDRDKRKISRNVSHFKRIPKSPNLYNASEADSERVDQRKENDDDDYNDAKRTNNVEERQRLVVRRSDRLRREPDRLGVPIPADIFR